MYEEKTKVLGLQRVMVRFSSIHFLKFSLILINKIYFEPKIAVNS